MERYQRKIDKKTGLVNDPNDYSDDPAYILNLLLSVITVSKETQELIDKLSAVKHSSKSKNIPVDHQFFIDVGNTSETNTDTLEIEDLPSIEPDNTPVITPSPVIDPPLHKKVT